MNSSVYCTQKEFILHRFQCLFVSECCVYTDKSENNYSTELITNINVQMQISSYHITVNYSFKNDLDKIYK